MLLDKYNAGWRWKPNMTCPDDSECRRGDAFLRRDCEIGSWQEMCGGNTCCLECQQAKASYSPCSRMCSKAKAQRKNEKCEAEAVEYLKMKRQGRNYQSETQSHAKRLLRAIEAAGLSDNERILWEYCEKHSVAVIRKWAAGDFDDPAGWNYARLVPGKCNDLLAAARLLGCSTDFLMGLTDELAPAAVAQQNATSVAEAQQEELSAGSVQSEEPCNPCKKAHPGCDKCCDVCNDHCNAWQVCRRRESDRPDDDTDNGEVWHWWPEQPSESGLYWCIRGPMSGGGGLYWWEASAGQWEHPGTAGVVLTPDVMLWMKCPELPESMCWERPELNNG